ncbi:MAG: hypothetical protein U0Y82_06885 [Thermoleophilia bacterium]
MRRVIIMALALTAAAAPAVPAAPARPVVWVQAGHEGPREPGYTAQTGAGGGPFGSEVAFTTRVAAVVVRRLDAAGVDARRTPGLVTPWGAPGATFISIHHDAAGGRGGVGHAVAGTTENWYHGEGFGTASPRPYADSAPHRRATTVSAGVERRSTGLARLVAARIRGLRAKLGGATAPFDGVLPDSGNVRMMHFYGYFRTTADARVLVECGAAGADDRFLSNTTAIGTALARAIVQDLRARGLLPAAG